MQITHTNKPLIMGIVNYSQDSFYEKSRKRLSNQLDENEYQYADIIDIGFESTRPGSKPVSQKIELMRLAQFLDKKDKISKTLSIDTYKPSVAKFALDNGFNMINDIKSGDNNNEMLNLAAEYDCPIVLMHMKDKPETMQNNPFYDNIIEDIINFFEKKLFVAQSLGIKNNNIILDPGIGFGKRIVDNDIILYNLKIFKQFNLPLLLGLSRKSFLSFNADVPDSRLPATMGANVLAIQNGVDILRVHDIEATYKLRSLLNRINNRQSENNSQTFYN